VTGLSALLRAAGLERDEHGNERSIYSLRHTFATFRLQHSRKGMMEMQFVEAPHQLQILGRNRPRRVVNRAARDTQRLRLPGDRKIVIAVDHLFALSNPAFVSRPDKKSFSSVSSPIFA